MVYSAAVDIGHITPDGLGDALERLRQGRPLDGSPLLGLAAVEDRLRRDGMAVRPASLAWCLGALLDEVVRDRLARARGDADGGAPAPGPRSPSAPADDRRRLADDFAAGQADREAWSCLYHRYFSPLGLRIQEIVALSGASTSHVRRRRLRGLDLLAGALRDVERAAVAGSPDRPAPSLADRIVVAPAPATAALPSPGATDDPLDVPPDAAPGPDAEGVRLALLAIVRSDDRRVRLTHAQAESVARQPAADLTEYRLGRVAEWSQPRYRLDDRFVELTLLVDRGGQAAGDRWQAREARFERLADVLAAVPDPAVVVLGPPGSGKSTLLRHFELERAVDGLRGTGDTVTFCVSLSQHQAETPADPPPAPLAWLAGLWRARHPALPPLEDLLVAGRLVLLLDALNEMPGAGDEAAYWARVHLWQRFLAETVAPHPGSRAVFACRSLDYSAPLSTPGLPVPQVRIEPLGDARVQAFLRRYAPAIADEVWAALEGTPQLEVFRAPYFLRLLVEQVEAEGGLPRGRAGLFTSLVRQALRREVERYNPLLAPAAGGGEPLLTARDARRVLQAAGAAGDLPGEGVLVGTLGRLAYGMQARHAGREMSQVRVGYGDALALIDHPRAADVVRAGAALGVLDEDVGRDEVLFGHQLVQEYFAARALARVPEPERVRQPWRAAAIRPSVREVLATLAPAEVLPPLPQTGWEETAVLAAALARNAEGFVGGLMEANLALAGRCASQPEVRDRLGEAFVDRLRWALVARSRDPEADLRARIAAGLALGDLGDPRFERRVGPYGEYLMPPLVEIPGGVYPIGDDEPIEYPGGTGHAHVPRHHVALDPFRIGRFSVTNAEYACFMASGGYADDRWWETTAARNWRLGIGTSLGIRGRVRYWLARYRAEPALADRYRSQGLWSEEIYSRWQRRLAMTDGELEAHLEAEYPSALCSEPRWWADERFNRPAQPVVGVSWYEARAYCAWLSAQAGMSCRLPSEVEWEAAARGPAARPIAYGDVFDAAGGNTWASRLHRPAPVGVFAEGVSPMGVSDMAGNASNWTSSAFGMSSDMPDFRYPYRHDDGREDATASADMNRVVRGGSWRSIEDLARAAYRYAYPPDTRDPDHGFRIAVSGSAAIMAATR